MKHFIAPLALLFFVSVNAQANQSKQDPLGSSETTYSGGTQEVQIFKVYSAAELKSKRPHVYGDLPFSFLIPVNRWAEVRIDAPVTEMTEDYGGSESKKDDAGLRVLTIDGKRSNYKKIAVELAERGILQTGDVLIKSNVKSAQAGMYYQLQGGATHSSIIVIHEVNGEKRVFNVDMPAYESGNLSSQWYRTSETAPFEHYHIFRPTNMTARQKENLKAWAWQYYSHRNEIYGGSARVVRSLTDDGRVIEKRESYRGRYGFNSDYSKSSFDQAGGDVALMAARTAGQINGYSTRGRADYCSGMLYNLHLLRGCSYDEIPARTGTPVRNLIDKIDRCIAKEEVFQPLGVFSREGGLPGLVDGPLLAMQALDLGDLEAADRSAVLSQLMKGVFGVPLDAGFKSSHQSTAVAINELKPFIEQYYQGMLAGQLSDGSAVQAQIQEGAPAELQGLLIANNYPPAAFIINALLPDNHPEKSFAYVLTFDFDREE